MKWNLRAVALVAPLILSACGHSASGRDTSSAPAAPGTDPFVAWAREHAIKITALEPGHGFVDLQPLKASIGQARVVALGESGHGIHEFLVFRNRLFEFLVHEMNFTAIAVETGFTEAAEVSDYVSGGAGDSATLAPAVFQWNPDGLEENRQLIEWMRNYNASTTRHKIRFYGVDLTGGRSGKLLHSQRAIESALAYVEGCDSPVGQKFRRMFAPYFANFDDEGYPKLSASERNALTSAISELVNLLERRRMDFLELTPESDYQRAHRSAVVARQIDAWFRLAPDKTANTPDHRDQLMARDSAIADNFRWVLDREGPKGRVLLFAHNVHVQKSAMHREAYPSALPNRPMTPAGRYLRSMLGSEMVVFGFAFQRSGSELKLAPSVAGSVDADLARVGEPFFALDLRDAPKGGSAAEWLNQPRKKRQWSGPKADRYSELVPIDCFDGLVFVDTVSAVRRIPRP